MYLAPQVCTRFRACMHDFSSFFDRRHQLYLSPVGGWRLEKDSVKSVQLCLCSTTSILVNMSTCMELVRLSVYELIMF
jgi:hypothetical protein